MRILPKAFTEICHCNMIVIAMILKCHEKFSICTVVCLISIAINQYIALFLFFRKYQVVLQFDSKFLKNTYITCISSLNIDVNQNPVCTVHHYQIQIIRMYTNESSKIHLIGKDMCSVNFTTDLFLSISVISPPLFLKLEIH